MDFASTVRKACAGTKARCTWQRRKRSRPYDRTGRAVLGATRPSRTSSLFRQWMSQFCCTSRACTSSLSLSDQSLLQTGCCTSPRGAQGIIGDGRDGPREVYGEEVWVGEVEDDEDDNEEEEQDDEEEEEEEEDSKEEKGEIEKGLSWRKDDSGVSRGRLECRMLFTLSGNIARVDSLPLMLGNETLPYGLSVN